MKFTIIASLLVSASAFAPASQKASSTALNSDVSKGPFEKELGSQAPLGFFDPFGMTSAYDEAEFARIRWVELKHGRVAMLAIVGTFGTHDHSS
jgi:hypothetical protein